MNAKPNKSWSFDIERAISTWRQFASRERSIREVDLEELEIHLRDEWEASVEKGLDPSEAFEKARRSLGDFAVLESAYRQVSLEKSFRRKDFPAELRAGMSMLGNYLRSAWRNVANHRGYAALNIAGLALAIAPALIIGLFIRHSLSFDRFHADVDRTYRITQDRGTLGQSARPSQGLADLIRDNWASAELVTQGIGSFSVKRLFSVEDEHFQTEGVLFVDANFLDFFSFPVTASTSDKPLESAGSVVLTESTARRLFGGEDPLGKTVRFDATTDLTVTAVVQDPPSNTHLPFNALIRRFIEPQGIDWNRWGSYTYVRLESGSTPHDLERFLNEQFSAAQPGTVSSFSLQPITEIYLKSGVTDDYAAVGDIQRLYLFGYIGILILIMAAINYVNLSAARASNRVKEIGVRKVVGASAPQIRRQFLVESVILTACSVPVALVLVELLLPQVNRLAGERLTLQLFNEPAMWFALGVLILVVALGAGIYPAVMMARQNPVSVFSGGKATGRSRKVVRRGLVGVQVAISFSMIVATILVSGQLEFIRLSNLGFDQEQVVTIAPRGWKSADFNRFKERVESSASVVSAALGPPLGIGWRFMGWTRKLEGSDAEVQLEGIYVGADYFETMDMRIVQGRSFQEGDLLREKTPVIVTESYVSTFGDDASIIGSQSQMPEAGPIIGVVADFRNASFMSDNRIALFQMDDSYVNAAVVRLAPGQTAAGLGALESAWDEISPDRPFEYEFLDEKIQAQYVAETRLSKILELFAGLSIVIASLGLFGVAAFTARQRVKEVGIRKSLGASETHLVFLLSRDFFFIVLAGIAAAVPVVYAYGNGWLTRFKDHIQLDAALFASAGLICLSFVLLAVGYQAVRAARTNPTEVLRFE